MSSVPSNDQALLYLSLILLATAILLAFAIVVIKWVEQRRERRSARILAQLMLAYDTDWEGAQALVRQERTLAERLLLEKLRENDAYAYDRFRSLGYMLDYRAAIRSRRAEVRAEVAHKLGFLSQDMYPEKLLLPLLKDRNSVVRAAAIRSLARVGSAKAVEALLEVMPAVSDSSLIKIARHTLASHGKEGLPAILKAAESGTLAIRFLALDVLAELRAPEAQDMLLDMASDREMEVRLRVARALRFYDTGEVRRALLLMSEDGEWQVRAQAAKALSWISGDAVTSRLQAMATDRSYWVRNNAVQSLRYRGTAGLAALKVLAAGSDLYAAERARESLDLLQREEDLA